MSKNIFIGGYIGTGILMSLCIIARNIKCGKKEPLHNFIAAMLGGIFWWPAVVFEIITLILEEGGWVEPK